MTNITVNEKARCIGLTKKDYAKACKFGTQEYIDLQEVRKAYPTFKVVGVTRKAPKTDKPIFKGLTYEYMEKYIKSHDNAEENMAELTPSMAGSKSCKTTMLALSIAIGMPRSMARF